MGIRIKEISAAEYKVRTINAIQDLYPDVRQDSKAPTFALQYQGTKQTLMKNCGFSSSKAEHVERRYAELYSVAKSWTQGHIDEATKTGYVTGAFGLRVRTPLLKQSVTGTRRTPKEVAGEARTAGNALGQGWGLLNNRAASAFMKQARKSQYWDDIRPLAHIHDAQYYMIREDVFVVEYVNTNLVRECQWQEHPLIAHDEVKLSGKLAFFHPSWNWEITIPNNIKADEIIPLVSDHVQKWEEKNQDTWGNPSVLEMAA